ncbi:MAG: hypothetical protein Tsb002_20060 [Wenzhouxiangellaceae bacterium]
MAWWRSKQQASNHLTLTARALDSRNLQLLRTTLAVLRLPQQWQYEKNADSGVVLVDIDREEGRRQWRTLLSSGAFYRVVPITADARLCQFSRGLAKPLRATPLESLLRQIGAELENDQDDQAAPESSTVNQLLLSEAIVQNPHDRFAIHLPEGSWFYIERDLDRVYATGQIDSLMQYLFQPLNKLAIKPMKMRPETFASGTQSECYSLSLLLWSAAQNQPESSTLKVLRGNRHFVTRARMPWRKLPHQPDQRILFDYLDQHGPMDLIGLVLAVGLSPERVTAFMAGAWLLGTIKPLAQDALTPMPESA